jgi:hypothetical protein
LRPAYGHLHEPHPGFRARPHTVTLGSLARNERCELRFGWSFHLNQFEVHSVQRVALNAAQLRRFGAAESLHKSETCEAPKRATNHLPVNSPAQSKKYLRELWRALAQRSGDSALDSARMRIQVPGYATTKSRAPSSLRFVGALQKKEDQCQES